MMPILRPNVRLVKSTSLDLIKNTSRIICMKKEIQLHPVQIAILRSLLFKQGARFSELNTTDLSNDHFTFHIQQLLQAGLLSKDGVHYSLTDEGKEFANRFDTDNPEVKVEKQAKLGVAICCVKQEDGVTKYLLQQRLKHPYYGYYGFMTGKIKWGESVYETAKRELEEEMGLTADLTLGAIKHKTDISKDETLLEDKYFFIFRGENPQGELIEEFEGGKNVWLSLEEIKQLPTVFHDLWEGLETLEKNEFVFEEKTYEVENY